MNIREIKEADIPTLAELYVSVFSAAPWNEEWQAEWATDRLSTIYNSPGFYGLVLENQHSIIAAALGRSTPFKGSMHFELVEFFVEPTCQGQGIGKRLFKALENGLVDRGCSFCTLLTARGTDAEHFYLKLGYRPHGKLIFMTRKLSKES